MTEVYRNYHGQGVFHVDFCEGTQKQVAQAARNRLSRNVIQELRSELATVTREKEQLMETLNQQQNTEFVFYDLVWYAGDTDSTQRQIGRFINTSHNEPTTYHILSQGGTTVSSTRIQHMTELEMSTEDNHNKISQLNQNIIQMHGISTV